MSGREVSAISPTSFEKSHQSFVITKYTSAIIVIVPLPSIIDDQLQPDDFGVKPVAFEKKPKFITLLKDFA